MPFHASKRRFGELVEAALAELPERFAAFLEQVPVEIYAELTPGLRRRFRIEPDQGVMGLYNGRPLTRRSVEDSGMLLDAIYLFQDQIEQASADEQDLIEQVRITVLHEIGHHFGLSEKDLDELGYG